jgi:hypothetical protein
MEELAKYAFKMRKGAYKKIHASLAIAALSKLGEYKGMGKNGSTGNNQDSRKAALGRLQEYFQRDRKK